ASGAQRKEERRNRAQAPTEARRGPRRRAPSGPEDAREQEREHGGHADRADESQRLAYEDLQLEPRELPQPAHRRDGVHQSRIEWPVSARNTSSRLGSTVLKSVTWIRCSDTH